jgi:diguanylate cyclase (GGDEF)-like protein/PAS domain S-box-containing protein
MGWCRVVLLFLILGPGVLGADRAQAVGHEPGASTLAAAVAPVDAPADQPVVERPAVPVAEAAPLDGVGTLQPMPWFADPVVPVLGALVVLVALVTLTMVARFHFRMAEGLRAENRELRARGRALFDHMAEGALISRDETILEANNAAEALTGRPREDLVGQDIVALVDAEDQAEMRNLLLSGDGTPRPMTLVRRDGPGLPVEARGRGVVHGGNAARLVSFRDLSIRMRLEDRMRRLATVDTISECLNRRAFLDQAEMEFERFRRYGRVLSVLMVDVDNLRAINAQDGHLAGDAVLRHLVRRCDALLRVSDAIGRYGGAECALLLPETPLAGALNVAQRLRADVEAGAAPFRDRAILYRVSGGVAEARPSDTAVIAVLERAEGAMRQAKREKTGILGG